MKILHTADVHIGKEFAQFENFASILRDQIKSTFQKTLRLAAIEHVNAVLLAGDVFDGQGISRSDIDFFISAVREIDPIPVFFLPGTWTHDGFLKNPIYRSRQFLEGRPTNLTIFTSEQIETFRIAEGRVAIHGRAVLPDSGNPLEGLTADATALFNIGLLHVGIALPQIPDQGSTCLLRREDVLACGLDYLALGDWHSFRRYFQDARTIVQYPGSPERVDFGEEDNPGAVALVRLDQGKVHVSRIPVGKFSWKQLAISCEELASNEQLRRELEKQANEDLILRVKLSGTLRSKDNFNFESLQSDLSGHFAFLQIDGSDTRQEIALDKLEAEYRDNTVERAFVTLLKEALQETEDPAALTKLSEILRRGHALFQGTEEIPE